MNGTTVNGVASTYATPMAENAAHMPDQHPGPHHVIPRELNAVKDAKNYERKGRTIIICLDGTGDKFDADNSNIVHLVACLKKSSPNQVVYYQSGIGTYDGGGLKNGINAGFDMAVGSGLGVHVRDAYRYLMQNYVEGDKICLFGFSRGAYTARCLAGMVHKVGLLPAHNRSQVAFAYEYYKDTTAEGDKMSADFKRTFCMHVSIHFIGVFDSVASVGFIPRKLPLSSTPNQKARYFRHAIALDERRAKFKVCRYHQTTNNSAEKATVAADGGYFDTDVKEVWFAGCHADVGGGAVANEKRHKLAQIPLRWMIRQTFECDTGIIYKAPMLAEEGIDVHTLWPLYETPERPTGGLPPELLDKYHKGTLGPINRRSSLLEPMDADDPMGMQKLKIYEDDEKTVHHEYWTPEQVEDYLDALQPINDQLSVAKVWWILEYLPIKIRVQPKDPKPGEWVKKVSVNHGRWRCAQEMQPSLHWTVKHRTDVMDYKVRTRVDKNAAWKLVV